MTTADAPRFTGEVHPVADLFPMLEDSELEDLAADIKAHGLLHPVVLDGDGRLIDGRNRLAACRIAGIEPRFTLLGDQDPVAYILSSNVHRRHMSEGARAMAVIEANSLLKFKKTQPSLTDETGLNGGLLGMAAVVHGYCHPQLCRAVIAGGMLTQAYEVAKSVKKRRDDAEKWAAEAEQRKEKAAAERDRKIEEIRLAREAIGPILPIPPIPDLGEELPGEAPDQESEDGEELRDVITMPALPQFDTIDAEKALWLRLERLGREIEEVCTREAFLSSWSPESHVLAIRSWASRVVRDVYGMVEAHNALLQQGSMRIVK